MAKPQYLNFSLGHRLPIGSPEQMIKKAWRMVNRQEMQQRAPGWLQGCETLRNLQTEETIHRLWGANCTGNPMSSHVRTHADDHKADTLPEVETGNRNSLFIDIISFLKID